MTALEGLSLLCLLFVVLAFIGWLIFGETSSLRTSVILCISLAVVAAVYILAAYGAAILWGML